MRLVELLLLVSIALGAQTLSIDSGSPTDSEYSRGSLALDVGSPSGVDSTVRYSPTYFTYSLACNDKRLYLITLKFLEPTVSTIGQRVFSVKINNQVFLDHLDIFAETGEKFKLLTRSIAIACSDNKFIIRFDTHVRNAIISSLEMIPLFSDLTTAAWKVINTRCTRCHGNDIVAGDTHLVGNLDMRTRESILQGGNRGPALIPGKLLTSLIYLYSSRFQLGAGPGGQTAFSPTEAAQKADWALGADFRLVSPESSEDSISMPPFFPLRDEELRALRDWILVGAP